MLLLATYDQIKSALPLSLISMANLQSVFLVDDQILGLKVQICKDNYQACHILSMSHICIYWRISAGTVYIVVFVQSDNPCFSLFVICAYCIFHLLIINIKFVSRLGLLDELIIEFRDQTIWRFDIDMILSMFFITIVNKLFKL